MLVVRRIGQGQAAYYLDGRSWGHWTGAGCPALGLGGAVDRSGLEAVLGGRDPRGHLLLSRLPVNRRAGYDLILAAPKSVSLLAALAPAEDAVLIESAHQAAVADTLSHLERQVLRTRRGPARTLIPTTGMVAAAFVHRQSWLGDPHLHSHVVLANLVCGEDGTWSCLDSRSLYRNGRAAGAVYQASLRHHLALAGLRLPWVVQPTGLSDVATVPRAAIAACSSSRKQILATTESGDRPSAGARRVAAGRLRVGGSMPDTPWTQRAAAAGLGQAAASAILQSARMAGPSIAPEPPDPNTVERSLSVATSTFTYTDCVRHVAAHTVRGAPSTDLEAWAGEFVGGAVASVAGRWTTAALRTFEEDIATHTTTPWTGAGLARAEAVAHALADRPGLSLAARQAVSALTTSGVGVERLGQGPLLAQATVLQAAGEAWASSGHRVVVVSRSRRAELRWLSLTGLGPPPPAPARPTVVIVDGVDRVPTGELHQVLADAAARRAKVVLVEGGTAPIRRHPESPAVDGARVALAAIDPGPSPDLSPAPTVIRAGRQATVAVAPTTDSAVSALIADWAATGRDPPPTLVALGPEEANALNAAARQVLAASGRLSGPSVMAGAHQWQAGDRIRALRRDQRLGSVPAGTVGSVVSVDPEKNHLSIDWPQATTDISADILARCPATYGYATTPAYLTRGAEGPVFALGDPGGRGERAAVYVVAPSSRRLHETGPAPPDRRRLDALGAAAEIRPTDTVLAHLGPPPTTEPERHAWREAAGAIEAYRDRWGLPDQPDRLDLTSERAATVVAACRAAERARQAGHELSVS